MNDPVEPRLSAAKSALLDEWRRGAPMAPDLPIAARSISNAAPLSFAQERIWFVDQFRPGTAAYNLSFCARAAVQLDPGLLARSVDALALRHASLRTTIREGGGRLRQVVDGLTSPTLETADFRALTPGDALAAALERADGAIHRPFDLASGPPARFLLCRVPDGSIFTIVAHHIVADGWSLNVALRDLSAIYESLARSEPISLPSVPIRYSDFAAWQRDTVRDEHWRSDLAYWRARLGDLPSLELPTDHPRPAIISARGDWREFRFPRPLSDALRALAREERVTPFMILLAAYALVLAKLAAQRDVVIGTAVANRSRAETFDLVGNFVNMLALRTSLHGDPTFRELLARVRETCTGAFAHQETPFERIVEELRPERDLSRSAMFQALFILQPPGDELRLAGVPLEPIELGSRTARADIELHLWDRPELAGRIAFSTDLFDGPTAERFAQRFRAAIAGLIADPNLRFAQTSIELPGEHATLEEWGRGPERAIAPSGVHELIEQQAATSPEACAVVFRTQRLTYGELDTRACRLAHRLRAVGAGPETLVAILLERSAEMIVAVLAVLKTGAAYVPLDPTHPAQRLAHVLRDARPAVIVGEAATLERTPAADVTTVRIDRDDVALHSGARLGRRVDPANLAYVIYTSGSTGIPKGVAITHRSLSNLVGAMLERPGLTRHDVALSVASLSFDASVAEIFPALAAGATLVVAAPEELSDGALLKRCIAENGVTVVQATATTWLLLQAAGGLDDRRISARCGGEATPAQLAEQLASRHDEAWNMYGPTETTVWSSSDRIVPGAPVALGRPFANTQLYVLDESLRAVPAGTIGELCIGGAGLARGYHDNPAATALRFVPDPFSREPGARLYRTGDMARYRAGGSLEFAGRRDHQVKLRGHRIELGEIEARLGALEYIERAVAVVREHEPGDARLIAYVVPRSRAQQSDCAPGRLRAALRTWLPEYMIPSAFVLLDALPTTPTGKVDSRSLPPYDLSVVDDAAYVEPRTPLEHEIADLAAELLRCERVGVRDDFFDAGGHSLLAARFVGELRRRYGVDLLLEELFIAPTVERLAALVEAELARQGYLASAETRMRRAVDGLPDETVDSLLRRLVAD